MQTNKNSSQKAPYFGTNTYDKFASDTSALDIGTELSFDTFPSLNSEKGSQQRASGINSIWVTSHDA